VKDWHTAGQMADQLIATEVAGQDKMWGVANERADSANGELFMAGLSQGLSLHAKQAGSPNAFAIAPSTYPKSWSGFRDYGSDVANLVVMVAFLRQEIKRKIANGESIERTKRNPVTQPYTGDQPTQLHPSSL